MSEIYSVAIPAFPRPTDRYETENESQFRRQLERSLTDVVAFVGRAQEDPDRVAAHVVATTSALGAQHTVSGLTLGQFLRATAATTAKFQAVQDNDLVGVFSLVTGLGTQEQDLDMDANQILNIGHAGTDFTGTGGLTLADTLTVSAGDIVMSASASQLIPGATSFSVRNNADDEDNLIILNGGKATFRNTVTATITGAGFGFYTNNPIGSETGIQLGANAVDDDAYIWFARRLDSPADELGGVIQINVVGVVKDIVYFKKNLTQFTYNPVGITGNLDVGGSTDTVTLAIGGSSDAGVPSFEIHDTYQTDRRIEATEFGWSVNSAESQTTYPTITNWPVIRSSWYRLSSAQADVDDVVLFMPVAYVKVSGQPTDEGWFKWTVAAQPDAGGVDLEIKAEAVTITGDLDMSSQNITSVGNLSGTLTTANQPDITGIGTLASGAVPASLVTAGSFGTGAYVFDNTITAVKGVFGDATGKTATATFEGNAISALFTDNVTDATTKIARMGCMHYTNAEEPAGFFIFQSTLTANILNLGGGTASFNAATKISVYTAADNTTPTGTERWVWTSAGHFIASSDNTYDFGGSGTGRVRNVYVAGFIEIAGAINVGGKTVLAAAGGITVTPGASGVESFLHESSSGRASFQAIIQNDFLGTSGTTGDAGYEFNYPFDTARPNYYPFVVRKGTTPANMWYVTTEGVGFYAGGLTVGGDITPNGELTRYAEISAFDAAATMAIGTAGIANRVQITAFDTDGPNNGATPAHGSDHITIVTAGNYLVTVSLTAESAGGGGADEIGFGVYANNGTVQKASLHAHRKLHGGGGDIGSISMSGIATFAASDTVEVWVWNENSTDDVVIDDINLSVVYVGD